MKSKTIYWQLSQVLLLIFVCVFLNGCFWHKDYVPGAREYGFTLNVAKEARDSFDGGRYFYTPVRTEAKGEKITKYGGRDWMCGCGYFDVLIMDFKFKDGRAYHEEIDLQPLIDEMQKKYNIPAKVPRRIVPADAPRGWYDIAQLKISITKNKLIIGYELSERVPNPEAIPNPGWSIGYATVDHYYPVFEKVLN